MLRIYKNATSHLQSVPEGECEGAGGLADRVMTRDTSTVQNHVDQSQILLPVIHLFQQNPVIQKHNDPELKNIYIL